MLREEIIKAVKARLDEFSPFEEPEQLVALPQSEVKPMDSIIENVLPKATDDVMMVVPLYLVRETLRDITAEADGVQVLGGSPVMERMDGDETVGLLAVPDDFLRLHTAKFDIWRRAVNETHAGGGEVHKLQRNPYTRGRTEKPVICISDGCFEIYQLTYDASEVGTVSERKHCTRFTYIPRAGEFETEVEDSVAPLVILEAARACLEIFGNTAGVKMMAEEEKTWLRSKV